MRDYVEMAATADARAAFNEQSIRLSWASPAANGATLLALAGIIGGVADPDFAIAALTIPICLLTVGLMVGVFSLHEARHCSALDMLRTQHLERIRVENLRLQHVAAIQKVSELNVEALRLLFPDPTQLNDEIQRLWKGLKLTEQKASKDSQAAVEEAQTDLQVIAGQWAKAEKSYRLANLASAALCGASLLIALFAHGQGARLQPIVKAEVIRSVASGVTGDAPTKGAQAATDLPLTVAK
ncbi:MAG: hypothetical protein K9G59_07410 [Caulobacter sp.]|nr:hypothetical protein [Caulobacter sp.]